MILIFWLLRQRKERRPWGKRIRCECEDGNVWVSLNPHREPEGGPMSIPSLTTQIWRNTSFCFQLTPNKMVTNKHVHSQLMNGGPLKMKLKNVLYSFKLYSLHNISPVVWGIKFGVIKDLWYEISELYLTHPFFFRFSMSCIYHK